MINDSRDFSHYILQRCMSGLIPINALRDLCENEDEFHKYAALREDIVIEIGALVSYYMMKHYPSQFPDDIEMREAYKRVEAVKDQLSASLDENVSLMNVIVKDEKRFRRYMSEAQASRNQA